MPTKKNRLQSALLKGSITFVLLTAVLSLAYFLDLHAITAPAWADNNLHRGVGGVLLYIATATLFSTCGVPRQLLSLAAGYTYGAAYGILWATVGLTLGCACGFSFSRFIARDALQKKIGKRIQHLDAFLARNPFTMTIAVRCFPLGNNALTNLAAGMTSIDARPFILGSAIGYLPQIIIFSLLGSGMRVDPVWRVSLATLLFVVATFFSYSLYKKYKNEKIMKDLTANYPDTTPTIAEAPDAAPTAVDEKR